MMNCFGRRGPTSWSLYLFINLSTNSDSSLVSRLPYIPTTSQLKSLMPSGNFLGNFEVSTLISWSELII